MIYDLSVSESLAILAYKQELTPATRLTLSIWLDCDTYINPDNRDLIPPALSIPKNKSTKYSILHLYNFLCILEAHYTPQQQSKIVRYILCST